MEKVFKERHGVFRTSSGSNEASKLNGVIEFIQPIPLSGTRIGLWSTDLNNSKCKPQENEFPNLYNFPKSFAEAMTLQTQKQI